jgi:spoIIIJ-associated protein
MEWVETTAKSLEEAQEMALDRLGDHETRLRIDVAQYRERRQAALTRFAGEVAAAVRDGGTARVLEPMSSADRKVVHDALADEPGVSSRSIGEDPNRKVIVEPANIAVGDSAVDNVIADEVDPTSSDDGADR